MAVITVRAANGELEQRELHDPPGKIRFSVGARDAPHAGVWTILGSRNIDSDVYIGLRAMMGCQKWSLHQTTWLYQWISRLDAWEFANSDDRAIDEWQLPPEVAGCTIAFSIRVRHQDLVQYDDDDQLPESILWVPSPAQGRGTEIRVMIVRPSAFVNSSETVFEFNGAELLDGFTLADGRYVLLVASTATVADDMNSLIRGWLDATLRQAPEGAVEAARSPRVAVGSVVGHGHVAWDLAIPPQVQLS